MSLLLGVNVDHVATLRQARYALMPDSPNAEPCPVEAALASQRGGADSITVHVRADRRHMQEADVFKIKEACSLPLNLEMGNTDEMLSLALKLSPTFVCLVPETREEVTTEGGLDAVANFEALKPTIAALQSSGIKVSLFIDPDIAQVEASKELGADMIELHTGCFANAVGDSAHLKASELKRLEKSARRGFELNLQVNAGHGINFENLTELFQVPHLKELNIGHSIIAKSMSVGLESSVRMMVEAMRDYPENS